VTVDEPVLSEPRAAGLRKILFVAVGFGGLLVLLAVAAAVAGVERFAVVVAVIGVALLVAAGGTLRALPGRGLAAKRGCLVTGVLLIVFAVPLVAVWIGLIMAITGVLMLFALYAPERETTP
jgi:hypothetical protein